MRKKMNETNEIMKYMGNEHLKKWILFSEFRLLMGKKSDEATLYVSQIKKLIVRTFPWKCIQIDSKQEMKTKELKRWKGYAILSLREYTEQSNGNKLQLN